MKKGCFIIPVLLMSWIFLNGCAGSSSHFDLSGKWGGEHIGMVVYDSSATLEYDCARGTIDEPIEPDDNGEFEVTGKHVFEHGGPMRSDETPDEHPALYKGNIKGKEMTLIVIITDTQKEVGKFSVTLGAEANIFKCL